MVEAVVHITRWDNDLGVRLPAAVADAAGLRVGQRVRVSVEKGRVIMAPIGIRAPSLAQRLALFDPARHGGEAMAAKPLGAERW